MHLSQPHCLSQSHQLACPPPVAQAFDHTQRTNGMDRETMSLLSVHSIVTTSARSRPSQASWKSSTCHKLDSSSTAALPLSPLHTYQPLPSPLKQSVTTTASCPALSTASKKMRAGPFRILYWFVTVFAIVAILIYLFQLLAHRQPFPSIPHTLTLLFLLTFPRLLCLNVFLHRGLAHDALQPNSALFRHIITTLSSLSLLPYSAETWAERHLHYHTRHPHILHLKSEAVSPAVAGWCGEDARQRDGRAHGSTRHSARRLPAGRVGRVAHHQRAARAVAVRGLVAAGAGGGCERGQ